MVEGKGSKTWEKAKQFCFTSTGSGASVITKDYRYNYHLFKAQAKAGADVLQVFDSWSGVLSPEILNFLRNHI